MKYVLAICGILALSMTAYGQQVSNRDQAAAVSQQAEGRQIGQTVGAGTQVVVHLQIVEVSLTKLRSLGFDLAKLPGDPDSKPNIDPTSGKVLSSPGVNDGREVWQVFEALRKDHLVKVVAEPTLATLSGETAVFNCGDQLPVPKPQQDGSVAIEYQRGTVVELTPEVLGDKVHLSIHGRLTELDPVHTMRVGKETVPGVRRRDFGTRAELKSGQTLTMRGLTQSRVEAINRGLPYIGEIPYVGAIFRRVEEKRNEIVMFVLVRPEIVTSSPTATPSIVGSQDDIPTPQAVRPDNAPSDASPATARRLPDGDTQR
jgi:pilus assembly protein CpaC